MVAKTLTTEFSMPGARSASAALAQARGAPATLKPQIKQMLNSASRLKDVMDAVRVLFTVDREGEQRVAGIHVDDAVHDRRPTMIQRTAARLDAVLGLIILGCVEVPQYLAVDGRVGAQMAVQGTGKRAARHDGD